MSENILVYDVGTSSVKTALFTDTGMLVSSIGVPYETSYKKPGWAEQDADAFWHAAIEGTHRLLDSINISSYPIGIISLCGHMNGMLAVDGKGTPTYPEIIHCDTRGVDQVSRILALHSQEEVYTLTGNRVDEFLSLPKLLWLQEHEPGPFKKTRFVINAKDYLRSRLTGIIGTTDFTDASLTGALNLKEKRWDEAYLSSLGISSKLFPSIHLSTDIEGFLTKESAALLHLPTGIPVCYGGGDAASATRGAMVCDEGSAYASLGSSAWLSQLRARPVEDIKMRMQHFYDLEGIRMNVCGTVQSAGSALQWARDTFFHSASFEKIEKELSALPMNNHLISLPYFMGERTPHWDPYARTSCMGISMHTTSLDIALSLYEGVAFGLFEVKEVYDELGIPITSFSLLGGGVKSVFWSEMIASVFGMPIQVHPHYQNGTSFGAALCAMVANKTYPSLDEAIKKIPLSLHVIEPDMQNHEIYQKYYGIYKKMYQALKPLFVELYAAHKEIEEMHP